VNLYSGFHIVKIGLTMCVITHGKFVSLFDLIKWEWVNHIEFEDDIVKLFRHYKTEKNRYQSILLKNGGVYFGILDYDEYKEKVPEKERDLKVGGTIVRFNEDVENSHTLYMVIKEATYYLKVLYRGKI
jgi:hypothetical protein